MEVDDTYGGKETVYNGGVERQSEPKLSGATLSVIQGRQPKCETLSLQQKECVMRRKRQAVYDRELPRKMYSYFSAYSESGAPSFSKFARLAGLTLEELERFRSHKEFDRAYRECSEIRRDYLIDAGLTKRCDPSLVKYLLGAEFKMGEDVTGDNGQLNLTLEVIE